MVPLRLDGIPGRNFLFLPPGAKTSSYATAWTDVTDQLLQFHMQAMYDFVAIPGRIRTQPVH